MSLALVQSRALLGLQAPAVTVEVHLANGLPSFTLVGLAEVEVKEARERVRSALQNAGLEFPSNKRITVNLAPADLPKDSGRFDLPIALGILAASGQVDASRLAGYEFAGELSLSGELRPVRGALATSLALQTQQIDAQLVLPPGSAEEAALVPAARVVRARHLLDVVRAFLPPGSTAGGDADVANDGWARLQATALTASTTGPDMADVKGQAGAKRALEIAAAGGHSLLMAGPPGSGKSMLAQRFAGLLPAMTVDEALESAAIASLAGRFRPEAFGVRPTGQPHHTASAVALVGGGSPPRPGEISLAHQGVLQSIMSLTNNLICWSRKLNAGIPPRCAGGSARAAGDRPHHHRPGSTTRGVSGPVPDDRGDESVPLRLSGLHAARLPLHARPGAPLPGQAQRPAAGPHRPACGGARPARRAAGAGGCGRVHRQHPRPGGAGQRQGSTNQALQGQAIDAHLHLDDAAAKFLNTAAARLGWSARSTHRALKVARTIADLAGAPTTEVSHVAEAVQYRRVLRSPV